MNCTYTVYLPFLIKLHQLSYWYTNEKNEYDTLNIKKVESCSANVYNGIQSNCTAQYEAVKSCLSDNPDEWAKCAEARRELDVCSVRNNLGELKK